MIFHETKLPGFSRFTSNPNLANARFLRASGSRERRCRWPRRARTRHPAALESRDAVPAPEPSDTVDLNRALDRLAPRQRLAVDCVYFAGLSVAETAAVMKCAEGTVKSTLSDARARLRSSLEVSG